MGESEHSTFLNTASVTRIVPRNLRGLSMPAKRFVSAKNQRGFLVWKISEKNDIAINGFSSSFASKKTWYCVTLEPTYTCFSGLVFRKSEFKLVLRRYSVTTYRNVHRNPSVLWLLKKLLLNLAFSKRKMSTKTTIDNFRKNYVDEVSNMMKFYIF